MDPRCPKCASILSGWGTADRPARAPAPGDPVICTYCGEVLVYDFLLCPVRPAPLELAILLADPDVQRTRALATRIDEWMRGTVASAIRRPE